MPELIEVEYYRRALDGLLGERLTGVEVEPLEYLRPKGATLAVFEPLVGCRFVATHRHGKLLLLEFVGSDSSANIGLRFGMTGRLLIDGSGPIDQLEYSSSRNDPQWDRVRLHIGESTVSVRDQRRLGAIEVDPDLSRLGRDAVALDSTTWTELLQQRTKALKALLLDQSIIAGLGNLLADEILWRSGLLPGRPACSLVDEEIQTLSQTTHVVIRELTSRGGSHRGDSFELRRPQSTCSRCGTEMQHGTVGGRSTWWCPGHQR